MIPLCGSIFLFGELLICSKKVYWSSFEERMYLSHPFCEPQRLDSKEMYFQRFSTQNIVENDLQTVLNDHIWKLKIEVDMIWHDSHGFPSTILCLNHSEKKNGTLKRHDSKAELPSGEIQLLLSRCNGQVLATACYCRCLGFWWVQFTVNSTENKRTHTHNTQADDFGAFVGGKFREIYYIKKYQLDE